MPRHPNKTVFTLLLLVSAAVFCRVEGAYGAEQFVDPLSGGGMLKVLLSLVAVCALAVLVLGRIAPRLHRSFLPAGEGRGPGRGVQLSIVRRTALSRENELVEVVSGSGEHLLFSAGRGGVVFQGWFDEDGRFYSEKLSSGERKALPSGAASGKEEQG